MTMKLRAAFGPADRYTRSIPIVASTPNAVPGQAAVTQWDLTRFAKNPVILWGHNTDGNNLPIGRAADVAWDPTVGLTMRVFFASEKVSELAESVWNGVLEGIITACSVGYDVDASGTAKLAEVSMVPIGLDEDAGTPAINPEASAVEETPEQLQARVRRAASDLAKHRNRLQIAKAKMTPQHRTDSSDLADGEVLRMDRTPIRLDHVEDTPAGGKKIPSRLSRTGILVYTQPDGTKRRELRLASEIFQADSLATLEGAPVIDIKDHTGMVTPDTWKRAALGQVHAPKEDGGRFISGMLHVNDRPTLDAIERGERTEISCGYRCRLDMTPGVHEGQEYDCVQRGIRYNHVALCPPNRGRAGPEVGLRLDNNAPAWGVSHEEEETTKMAIKIRFDGREMEEGTREHLDAVERAHNAAVEKVRLDAKAEADKAIAAKDAELASAKTKLDSLAGEKDAALQQVEAFKTDAAKREKEDKDAADEKDAIFKKGRSYRRKLERMAIRLFGLRAMKDDDDDKLDAKLDAMTDRELQIDIIKNLPGGEKFDAKDTHGHEYLQARLDSLSDMAGPSLGRGVNSVVAAAHNGMSRLDAGDAAGGLEGIMAKARADRDKAHADAGAPVSRK